MSNKRKMNDTKNPDEGDTGTSFAVKAPVSMAPSSTPMSSWTPINRPRPPPPTTLTQIKSKHPAASTIPATVAAASVNITNMTNKRMSTTMDSNEVPWCPNYENKPLGCQDVYCTLKHSMVRRDAAYMKVEDASEDDSAEEDVEASAAENVAPAAMNYAVKATPTSTTSKDKMPTTTSFIALIIDQKSSAIEQLMALSVLGAAVEAHSGVIMFFKGTAKDTGGFEAFLKFETKSSMTCASVKAQIVPAAYRTKFNIRGSKASVKKLPDAISTPVPRPVMAEITSQTAFPDILINTDPTAKHTRTALPQGPPSSPPPFKMPSMTRTRTYTARRVGRAPRTNTQAPPPTPAKGGEENLDIVLGNIDGTPCTEAETKELEEKMKKEREKVHGTYVKKELRDIAATQRQRALWKTRENKKGANWL